MKNNKIALLAVLSAFWMYGCADSSSDNGDECINGEQLCVSEFMQLTCVNGVYQSIDCKAGCNATTKTCNPEMTAECNGTDYPKCDGDNVLVCSGGKVLPTPCHDGICVNGQCVPKGNTTCHESDYPLCDGNNRLTCNGGQIQSAPCIEGVCLNGECIPNEEAKCHESDYPQCDGNNQLTCNGGQIQSAPCSDGICLNGECVPNEEAKCNESDYPQCDGNNVLTCVEGQIQSKSCGQKTCSQGNCIEPNSDPECDETDYPQCDDDNNRLTCESGKIVKTACGEKTCTDGNCVEPPDTPDCNEADYPQCDEENNRLTCESGKIVKTSCGENTCTNGVCVFVPECSEADYPKCDNDNNRLSCESGKIVTRPCGTDQTCKSGVCEDTPCTPGTTSCRNGKLGTCKDDQTWDLQACRAGEICQIDKCVAHGTAPEITECPTLSIKSNQTCEKTGSGSKLVLRGDVLGLDKTYLGGSVVIEGSKITYVGCDPNLDKATVITCPDSVISPALINGHEHMTFSNGVPATWPDKAEKFDHRHDWRKGNNGHTKVPGPSTSANNGNSVVEVRALMAGTTSIFGSGSAPGLARNLDIKNSTIGGVVSVYQAFPLNDSGGKTAESGCSYDYKDDAKNMDTGCPYGPHIAEGINQAALNELRCLSGSGNKSIDIFKPNLAVIHGIGATLDIIKKMAQNNVKLIWSPRTNIYLYGDTAQAPLYDRMGVTIGLGTDWIYSGSANMLRELQCVDYVNKNHYSQYFSDYEIWKMPTWNNAVAFGVDKYIGKLEKGYNADVVMFKKTKTKTLYRAVIEANNEDVLLVTMNGVRIFGNTNIMDSGSPVKESKDCAPDKVFDFKAANAKDEIIDYDFIKAAAAYNMYFCDAPKDEPSCIPQRTRPADTTSQNTTLYNGDFTDENDADGDGIPNDVDNCPTMFNPIRPMETDRKQTDTDGDGYGDICDPYPNCKTNDASCDGSNPTPVDTDGDTLPDDSDNCPKVSNKDQADKDGDTIGDVCDEYPECAANNESCNAEPPTPGDLDNDTIPDDVDNCPTVDNADQADADSDGLGDACDLCPNGNDCPELTTYTVDFSCTNCKSGSSGYAGIYTETVGSATFKAVGNYQKHQQIQGITLTGDPNRQTRIDITGLNGLGSITISYISFNPTGGKGTFDVTSDTFAQQITHIYDPNNILEVTAEPIVVNDSSVTSFAIVPTKSTEKSPDANDNRVHITKVSWTTP